MGKPQRKINRLLNLHFAPLLLVAVVLLTACPSNNKVPHTLSWGLLDKSNNVNTQLSDGASFTLSDLDQYIVTLQVKDPDGIKEMDVSGSGTFKCSYIDPHKTIYDCGSVSYDLIPKQTQTINSSGTYQGFVMSAPFTYHDVACGTYQGNKCQAYSGTVNVKGTETSWPGAVTNATLSLNPQ